MRRKHFSSYLAAILVGGVHVAEELEVLLRGRRALVVERAAVVVRAGAGAVRAHGEGLLAGGLG